LRGVHGDREALLARRGEQPRAEADDRREKVGQPPPGGVPFDAQAVVFSFREMMTK
jgi:hypothetical protein